jgi:hypothetical protein
MAATMNSKWQTAANGNWQLANGCKWQLATGNWQKQKPRTKNHER